MPFVAGKSTESIQSFKRYVGIAPVKVLAVNPSAQELANIYGQWSTDEPVYISEKADADGNIIKNARITFIIKTDSSVVDKDNKPVDLIARLTFFLRKQYRKNRDGSKVQVIDKYGNHMAWPSPADIKQHVYPLKSASGKELSVDTSYRPCIDGEDKLTDFLKAWLNIPAAEEYVNGVWVKTSNPEKCEARLDNIMKYFDGNFDELKSILNMTDADGKSVKDHTVKVLFGVRTSNDNRLYQEVYNNAFLRGYSNSLNQLNKELNNDMEQGRYSNTEFKICPLEEYVEKPTVLSKPTVTEIPLPTTPSIKKEDLDPKAHEDDLPFSMDDDDLPL